MIQSDVKLAPKMKALRQRYLEQLEQRMEDLKLFVASCKDSSLAPELKDKMRDLAHKLSGSGATYGFGAISEAAHALEETLLVEPQPGPQELGTKAQLLLNTCVQARGFMALRKEPDSSFTIEAPPEGKTLPVILAVDDDESIQTLLPQIFESEAEVIIASDGREALKLIEQKAPDIILLDDNMPNLSGRQLLRTLSEKDQNKKTAVVMLTANKNNKEVVQAFMFGILDYVVKPFDPAALRTRVMGLLNRIRHKILVADDDPAIRDLLGTKFQSMGFQVMLAEDGSSAHTLATTKAPDLMILDRMLPGGDGLSVFLKLKENAQTKDIPVLFLTAKRREEDILEAFRQGAQDYVIKPFKLDEVVLRCLRLMELKSN